MNLPSRTVLKFAKWIEENVGTVHGAAVTDAVGWALGGVGGLVGLYKGWVPFVDNSPGLNWVFPAVAATMGTKMAYDLWVDWDPSTTTSSSATQLLIRLRMAELESFNYTNEEQRKRGELEYLKLKMQLR